jgi:PTH1 family peptidyl-tRNA hydrolase
VTVDATMRGPDGDENVMLLKPMTYMNLSGASVADALRFFKLDAGADLFVLVDDVALPSGAIRVRAEGSAGGHNGLADVERRLGTATYARCRIGVDGPGIVPQADYVTGRFSGEQWPAVNEALDRAADAAEVWVARGVQAAMNRFNVKPASKDAGADTKDSE